MARWLLKTEPSCYSFEDLKRDKKTTWDGISNAVALKHIRTMKKGDEALIYHTGDQRRVIGTATISSEPYPNPKEDDDRLTVVDLKAGKALDRPVSLDEFKADPAFAGWDLLRIGRLSVVPVPDKMWKRIEQLARQRETVQERSR